MSIRLQLLIVALSTLALPWAGCQYARELEAALRVSQENALQASADTIAHALSAQPQRVFGEVDGTQPFDPAQGDLYVFPLAGAPLLDGYREDWNVPLEPGIMPTHTGLMARLQAGATERYLYLFVEVDDPHFDAEPSDVHPQRDRFDRVDLTVQRPDGALETYFFATDAPGLIGAMSVVQGDDGVGHAVSEPRIQAFWLQTSRGYHLEARLPLSLVGAHVWMEAIDGGSGARAGFPGADSMRSADSMRGGRLFFTKPGLSELLATFIGTGTRATVLDANALKLGIAGNLRSETSAAQAQPEISWYRRLLRVDTEAWPLQVSTPDRMQGRSVSAALAGHAYAQWQRTTEQELVLSAAAPIMSGDSARGAVVLEQATDQLLGLRDRALAHLFNLTLLATVLAVAFVFAFATRISWRIGRLREAADSALANDGTIRLGMPESTRADEIGDLARGFERLLARLNEHTQYLRTLGGKLSHELRTPLTIVRSSLDNLESEGVRADQRGYLERARAGVLRLQSILSSLGAAARVEESIKQTERVNFDLREILLIAVAGYGDAFPDVRLELDAPPDPCRLRGAPELMLQLLDKLVENAVDFCPAAGVIAVRLRRVAGNFELTVQNDGPPIPTALLGRLFESLFEHRQGQNDKPHFGLGLYIVRLIAEFHHGTAVAANRPDAGGALFTVILPLI